MPPVSTTLDCSPRPGTSPFPRRMHSSVCRIARALVLALGVALGVALMTSPLAAQARSAPPITGRWDLTVTGARGPYASWLEVERSGFRSLVGRFVGRIGAARPVERILWVGDTLRFSIPPQWDMRSVQDLQFEARYVGDSLVGTIAHPNGVVHPFVGRRAPSLRRERAVAWGATVPLLGSDLGNWMPDVAGTNNWMLSNGVLANRAAGANLATRQTFTDFRLRLEFRYPERGDGGVMLRGRYELQIKDDREVEWPTRESIGSIYGFIEPNENAARRPGEWQSLDVTLVGRHVTVTLNGRTVIDNQIIPGPTGSAVDSDEGRPGPLVLQGEEGPIEFRNIRVTLPRNP